MKKLLLSIVITLFLVISCTSNKLGREWYLLNDDIKFVIQLKKQKFILYEKEKLIFEAFISKYEEKDDKTHLRLKLIKVGLGYTPKYRIGAKKSVWIEINHNSLNLFMDSVLYRFSKKPKESNFNHYLGRIFFQTESDNILKSESKYNLLKKYYVQVITESKPEWDIEEVLKKEKTPSRRWMREQFNVSENSIHSMIDYTYDMDSSSYFSTKNFYPHLILDYFFKRTSIQNLERPISVQAILIRAGNTYNTEEYFRFHRVKKMTLYFSKLYSGGLGLSPFYFDRKITITLPDKKQTFLVFFYKPVLAKVIRVSVDSYYIGEKDALAIFDLGFYNFIE